VLQIQGLLLGPDGESFDGALAQVHLTDSGRVVKVRGWRRALQRVLTGIPGVKKALQWGNIILGSLGSVPVVGTAADAIKELKEAVEAQGDDDQSS
jgi:hypothetical protein